MKELKIDTLEKHIDLVRTGRQMAEDLNADTEPFGRYLGGLLRAYELVTGNEYPEPKDDSDADTGNPA